MKNRMTPTMKSRLTVSRRARTLLVLVTVVIALLLGSCGGPFQSVANLTVDSASPARGPAAGGTVVTVEGAGFFQGVIGSSTGTMEVSVCGSPLLNVQVQGAERRWILPGGASTGIVVGSMLTGVTSPAADVSIRDVVLVRPDGETVTLEGAFECFLPGPELGSFAAVPSMVSTNDDVAFSWVVTSPGSERLTCTLDPADGTVPVVIDDCHLEANRSATHAYAAVGTYEATLHVVDEDGDAVTAAATVEVSNAVPVANFTATPDSGFAPLSVTFDASSSSDPDGAIVAWTWNFGDGVTGSGPSVTHVYATAGTFTASLTVTDDSGATASATHSIGVQAAVAPAAADDVFVTVVGDALVGDLLVANGGAADGLGAPGGAVVGFGGGDLGGDATANPAGATVPLAGGTLSIDAAGVLSFTNPVGAGTYAFMYRLANAAGSSDASVTIHVHAAPTGRDDSFSLLAGADLVGDLTIDNGHGVDELGNPVASVASFGGGDLGSDVAANPAGASVPLAGGVLSVTTNGAISLVGAVNAGTHSFDYRLENSAGVGDATVTIVVRPLPAAANDVATVVEDATATTIAVLANDANVGALVLVESVSQPANGTAAVAGDGSSVLYTPDADTCNDGAAPDSFTYVISGGSSASVAVSVTCVDDAPVAVDDAVTVMEDDPASTVDVLANDTDVDGGPMDIASVTQPVNGTVVIATGGADLTYAPDANYCNDGAAPDTFAYTLNGGSSGVVSVSVTCVDDPPVAVDDAPTVPESAGATTVDVLANDSDVDGGPISIVSVMQPANGAATIGIGGANLVYDPNPGYCNDGAVSDDFTYTLSSGSTATVAVTVSCFDDPPVAVDDSATLTEDASATTIAVLANDTDVDGGPMVIASVVQPTNGTVAITNSGADLTYAPDANYCNGGGSTDDFTYTLDGGSTATVAVTVTCVADAPIAVADTATTDEDARIVFNVLSNDSDPDGDGLTAVVVDAPTNGSVIMSADGTANYTPNADFNGTDEFTYKASDSVLESSVVTATITVTAVNDAPVAAADAYRTVQDIALVVPAPGVLANDSDVDGDGLTAAKVTDPANGTVTVITDGSFTYTPSAGYTGFDSFTYKANDGTVDSNVVTVSITVDPPNFAPTAADGSDTLAEDSVAQSFTLAATDPEECELTFSIVDAPDHGTLGAISNVACVSGAPNADTAMVEYTPDADYAGPDSFTFKANDGTADSNVATFSITVTAVNDAPVLANLESTALAYTEGDSATAISSAITVTDVDSGSLSGATVSVSVGYVNGEDVLAFADTSSITGSFDAASGVLTLAGFDTLANYQAALRAVTYQNVSDNPGASKTVAFQVNDGSAANNLSNVATRAISITGVNDAPVNTVPAAQSVNEDTDLVFSSGNGNAITASDVDANAGSVSVTVSAANGTLTPASGSGATVSGSGTGSVTITGTLTQTNAALNGLTYRGNANYNSTRGAEAVNITTSDMGNTGTGGALTDSDTIGITVAAVNDQPVAQAKSYTAHTNMKIVGLGGLLTGATDPDTGDGGYTATFTVGTVSFTTPAGGTVSNLDSSAGTFDFDPPPGVTGSVTFTYTVCDSGNPAPSQCSLPATVTVTVGGPVIWFVNPAAGVNGDGRLSSPFNVLSAADAVDAANQRIFVYSGTASTGFVLNAGEWLIGQGVTGPSFDSVFSIAPPTGTIARPSIGGARPTIQGQVTMTGGSAVRGLNIAPASGTVGLSASSATGLLVGEVSVATGNATAVSLVNSDGTFNFTRIDANGGANGIVWTSPTAATGSFTVSGTGAAGSGGSIQNTIGHGVHLINAGPISLTDFAISGSRGDGIQGAGVSGLTLVRANITNSGDALNERGIAMTDLTGVASITGSTFATGYEDNVRIRTNGTLKLTVASSSFTGSATTVVNDGLLLIAYGNGNVTASITGSTFTNNRGDHFQFNTEAGGNVVANLTFTHNTLTNTLGAGTFGGGVTVSASGNAMTTFNVANNNIQNAISTAILVDRVSATGTHHLQGTIQRNVIGNSSANDSGSFSGHGIDIDGNGLGTITVLIDSNQVYEWSNAHGIRVIQRDGNGRINATITSNTLSSPGSFGAEGVKVQAGSASGDAGTVYLDLRGNMLETSGNTAAFYEDVRVQQRFNTMIYVEGYAGAANGSGLAGHLDPLNPGGETYNVTSSSGTGFANTGSVPLPASPALP